MPASALLLGDEQIPAVAGLTRRENSNLPIAAFDGVA
jgi:hypothetical protein